MSRNKTTQNENYFRTPQERLAAVREALYPGHGGKSALAAALGIRLTSYVRYESDQKLPADLVAKLVSLARVNPRWLAHGKGEMFLATAVPAADDAADLIAELLDEADKLRAGPISDGASEYIAGRIPIISGAIRPGTRAIVLGRRVSGWAIFPAKAIRRPASTVAIRAGDAGMGPGIPEGSLAAIDLDERESAGLVAVVSGDGCILRWRSGEVLQATADGFAPAIARPREIVGRVEAVIACYGH